MNRRRLRPLRRARLGARRPRRRRHARADPARPGERPRGRPPQAERCQRSGGHRRLTRRARSTAPPSPKILEQGETHEPPHHKMISMALALTVLISASFVTYVSGALATNPEESRPSPRSRAIRRHPRRGPDRRRTRDAHAISGRPASGPRALPMSTCCRTRSRRWDLRLAQPPRSEPRHRQVPCRDLLRRRRPRLCTARRPDGLGLRRQRPRHPRRPQRGKCRPRHRRRLPGPGRIRASDRPAGSNDGQQWLAPQEGPACAQSM